MTQCRICGCPTSYESTRLCDPCWQIEHQIRDHDSRVEMVLAHNTKLYTIQVDEDGRSPPRQYKIIASSEVDARVIAFCMDGGAAQTDTYLGLGDRELAKKWTEVLHEQ